MSNAAFNVSVARGRPSMSIFSLRGSHAMSMPVPGGHLVLVNTGLMNLVFGVLKIHVLAAHRPQ